MKPVLFVKLTVATGLVASMSACVNIKTMVYFNKTDTDTANTTTTYSASQLVFKAGDIVIVDIYSPSKETAVYFNYSETYAAVAGVPVHGYLVDFNGNIEMPMIGQITLKDKTSKQVQEEVRGKIEKYLVNPSVNVRLVNFKITLLGEFAQPGTFVIENNTITLFEALGKGQDLNIYANRSITLIREVNGKKTFNVIDLTNKEQFTKSIYLQNGDIVYAPPIRERKIPIDRFYRIAPLIASGASLVLLTILNLRKT